MHPTVREFEQTQTKKEVHDFRPGDTLRVSVRIVEGEKERIQDFEGVCIRRRGGGMNETFTVRRISYGVGMERIFPINSPRIENIRVVRRGKVRRANLGYLRSLRGKKARITEDLLRSRKIAASAKEAAKAEAAAAEAQARAEAEQAAAEAAKAQAAEAEAQAAEAEAQAAEEQAPEAPEAAPQATEAAEGEEKA